MSIFGWSLPPGCSMNDIDPPEQPCEVCGKLSDACDCPECPVCGAVGCITHVEPHKLYDHVEKLRYLVDRAEAELVRRNLPKFPPDPFDALAKEGY